MRATGSTAANTLTLLLSAARVSTSFADSRGYPSTTPCRTQPFVDFVEATSAPGHHSRANILAKNDAPPRKIGDVTALHAPQHHF
ncbi:hypothetical protein MTP99_019366 [Tenebrio molitor]|nr:hypothetical protein MTP99_019366 [Tenebrio molitor]